jgi:hypothetical protein
MPSHRMDLPYRGAHPGSHYERGPEYDDRHHPHARFHDGRRHSIDDGHGQGHAHHRPRDPYGPPRRELGVPFEGQVSNLFGTVEEAKHFFSNFEHSFLDDTQRVQKYATPKILDELWFRKIEASQRPPRNRRRHGGDSGCYGDEQRDAPDENTGSFPDMVKELKDDYMSVIHSSNRARPSRRDRASGPDKDSISHFREKINSNWGFIQKFINQISQQRNARAMSNFLVELDQCLNILDKNRDLWEGGQGRDDDGGYGDGHGSDGGGDGLGGDS